MNALKRSFFAMAAIIGLITIGYAARAVSAVDAFIIFTDKDGKTVKVKINPDGTFTTPPLQAGTYKWSFGATQTNPSSGAGAGSGRVSSDASLSTSTISGTSLSSGGDNPSESISLNFTKIEMKYQEQSSESDLARVRESPTLASTGKRMHKPFTITKELDRSSPTLMTDLGTVVVDADGSTVSGTVMAVTKTGSRMGWDIATQKKM